MKTARRIILDWAGQGAIPPENVEPALRFAGAFPSKAEWRKFLDYLFLVLGTAMLGAGVIFFFAYNWKSMGRYAKFGLIEAIILLSLFFVWRSGLERLGGKAALFASALFVGALLALVGQTYQTGADTWQLFGTWAAMILPWALLGRMAALWMLWLLLLNTSAYLYYALFGGLFGLLFTPEQMFWALFALNTLALVTWEAGARAGIVHLREKWATRILATASGTLITTLIIYWIVDWDNGASAPASVLWPGWLAAAYWFYRRQRVDVYVLAGGVLSVVTVTAVLLGRIMIDSWDEASGFLIIALVVIGMSAAGGNWLKRVAREDGT